MTVRKKAKIAIAFMLPINIIINKKALNTLSTRVLGAFIKLFCFNLVVLQELEISDHKQCYKHMRK